MRRHSALLIADYIIAKGAGKFTPLVVNKLTYLAHGHTLGELGEPLVKDKVEAWRYGPVFPSVYHAFSEYKANPIPNLYYCDTALTDKEVENRMTVFKSMIDEKAIPIIDLVIEKYGVVDGGNLIKITHAKGTPWQKYYEPDVFHTEIPDAATMKYYQNVIQNE